MYSAEVSLTTKSGIRELRGKILRDEGHDILLAENASAARAARNAVRPDMVLLDIWMPTPTASPCSRVGGQRPAQHAGGDDVRTRHHRHCGRGYLGAIVASRSRSPLQKLLAAVKAWLQRPQAPGAAALTLAAFTRSVPLRGSSAASSKITGSSRVLLLRIGAGTLAELVARSGAGAERAVAGPGRCHCAHRHQPVAGRARRRALRRRARAPVARAAEPSRSTVSTATTCAWWWPPTAASRA